MKLHLPYLLLSIAIAVLLWFLASTTRPDMIEKTYSAPVQLQNGTSLKVVRQSVETVTFKVKLSRDVAKKLNAESFVVKGVIPAGTSPGQYVAFLRYELPPNTSFISMFPDEVIVELR